MHRAESRIRNERGATLVFVALLIVALFGLFSLAVDVGVWMNTRGEAQRVADASALAGAGVFMYNDGDPERPADIVAGADSSARDFAGRNYVGETMLAATQQSTSGASPYFCSSGPDVDVCVQRDSQLVRVTVRGANPPLFARMIGVDNLPVAARAAARVIQAGRASCVMPFAIPDMWQEATQDRDFNRVWDFDRNVDCNGKACTAPDGPEVWSFDAATGDVYNPGVSGYGTTYRNGQANWQGETHTTDFGRRIPIKIQSAQNVNVSSFWYPWEIPGTGNGLNGVIDNMKSCIAQADVGEQVDQLGVETKNGNSPKPIYDAFKEIIAQDPDATWSESEGKVVYPSGSSSPYAGDWRSSPRVITIAVFDPTNMEPGKNYMDFVDFAQVFLEDPDSEYSHIKVQHQRPITGRMLHYVEGEEAPEAGNLIRKLQLVQ